MVRRSVFRWTLAALALVAARPATADPITFTGNVDSDFKLSPGTGVVNFVPHPLADGSPNPHAVPQDAWMTNQGLINGWEVKDVRLQYDKATDTLSVGLNTWSVAGDASGTGNPTATPPQMKAEGGKNEAHLGGDKSITVGFSFNNSSTPSVLAGVPSNKAEAGPGIDGFTVASYRATNMGIQNSYGPTLTSNLGGLAFDPSAAHPGFEFTVKNFSKIPGNDLTKGFTLSVYAGSPEDVVAGEDSFSRQITLPSPERAHVPEPATLLAWTTVLAGGAAIRNRRRLARS